MTDLSRVYFRTPGGSSIYSQTCLTPNIFQECQSIIDWGYEIVGTEGIK